MRELKILLVLVVFTAVTYYGIEPFAHGQMHPHVDDADYSFKDITPVSGGNATHGAELVAANCLACHSITSQGFAAPMNPEDAANTYGVVPPDLSNAGLIYDATYLAGYIKNPAVASKVSHKMGADKQHPMPNYDWMGDTEISSVVEYLKSIAPKELSDKQVFEDACSRCHSMKYAQIASVTPLSNIKTYMGTTPPDLSMMIRSRGEHYLHNFVNDPQRLLPGTGMPRVGLTEHAEEQVVGYIASVGDSKKSERDSLGLYFIIYFAVFSIFAYAWKRKIWSKLH